MTKVQRRVMVAYADADPKPDVITLPREQWNEMLDGCSRTVRENYAVFGFFWVSPRKSRAVRTTKTVIDAVPAFTYKAVPVVVAEDYAELMTGHRSSRIVLAV